MPLTENQENNLNTLLAVMIIVSFLGGVGYLIFWAHEIPYTQHKCAGTTMVNVVNYNNGEDDITFTFNDPKCE